MSLRRFMLRNASLKHAHGLHAAQTAGSAGRVIATLMWAGASLWCMWLAYASGRGSHADFLEATLMALMSVSLFFIAFMSALPDEEASPSAEPERNMLAQPALAPRRPYPRRRRM